MSLSDIARKLQSEGVSPEVLELRRMRKFIAIHNYDEMNGRWIQVAQMQAQGYALTLEGRYQMMRMQEELNRDYKLLEIFRETIARAEKAERRERGGGAAFYRKYQKGLRMAEAAIYQKAKLWENMQVSIEELQRMEEGKGVIAFGETANGEFIKDVRGDGAYYSRAEFGNETAEHFAWEYSSS